MKNILNILEINLNLNFFFFYFIIAFINLYENLNTFLFRYKHSILNPTMLFKNYI
jgi:hypothetical protein